MEIAFIVLGFVGLWFGSFVGKTTRTMSSGPRQGSMGGALLITAGVGIIYGVGVGLFAAANVILTAGVGLLIALVAFGVTYGIRLASKR